MIAQTFPVSISSDITSQLDGRIRLDLQALDDRLFWWVAASAIVVAIGCLMEGPEILHELWPNIFSIFSRRWVKHVGLVGWLFVVLGVAAEGVFEVYDHHASGLLQTFDELLVTDAQRNAGNARLAANAASDAAKTAREQSDAATVSVAVARSEADSLTQEILDAKNQSADASSKAADAVSRLAGTEQQLAVATQKEAEATQRELAAEEALRNIKMPRSLVHTDALTAALKQYAGTPYILNTFMDDESVQFTRAIGNELEAAGWIRKQPAGLNLGIPAMSVAFREGSAKEIVPSCVENGVSVHAHTKRQLAELQAQQFQNLPQYIRAALALINSIPPSITPSDPGNVQAGVVDPNPAEESVPMTICVGKKP